jgi:hypothetical protein
MRSPMTVARARQGLRQAIDVACIARGEAQWMHGYRTARLSTSDWQRMLMLEFHS